MIPVAHCQSGLEFNNNQFSENVKAKVTECQKLLLTLLQHYYVGFFHRQKSDNFYGDRHPFYVP